MEDSHTKYCTQREGMKGKIFGGTPIWQGRGVWTKGGQISLFAMGSPSSLYSTWHCVLLLEIFILRDLYFKSIMLTLTLLDKHFVSFRSQDIGVQSIDSYSNFQRCAISIVVPLPNLYSKDIKQAMYCALKKYTHAPPSPLLFRCHLLLHIYHMECLERKLNKVKFSCSSNLESFSISYLGLSNIFVLFATMFGQPLFIWLIPWKCADHRGSQYWSHNTVNRDNGSS